MATATHSYVRIAADLRRKIDDRHYAPGADLPSENELAATYSVNRTTARHALEVLRADGLITVRQGARARVREEPMVTIWGNGDAWRQHRAAGRPGFNATVAERGYIGRQEILDVQDRAQAPVHVAVTLGLRDDQPVVVRYVRQLADDVPSRLVRMWFPAEWASGTALAEWKRIRGGVAAYIEDPDGPIKRRLAKSIVVVGGRATPTRDERKLLERGVSVLEVVRTFLDPEGVPVFVQQEVADATRNRYEFEVAL